MEFKEVVSCELRPELLAHAEWRAAQSDMTVEAYFEGILTEALAADHEDCALVRQALTRFRRDLVERN